MTQRSVEGCLLLILLPGADKVVDVAEVKEGLAGQTQLAGHLRTDDANKDTDWSVGASTALRGSGWHSPAASGLDPGPRRQLEVGELAAAGLQVAGIPGG